MRKLALTLVLCLAAGGCESVSPENIEKWKGTQKGPGKLKDALKSASVSPALRAEAAAALVAIGEADQVDLIVAELPQGERAEIARVLVPRFAQDMKGPDLGKARTARDALFSLRPHASPDDQRQIDAALLPSVEADLRAGRPAGGRHSHEKMLGAVGATAAPMLISLLEDPKVPFQAAAELLARIGDDASRERGGAALVKRAGALAEVPPVLWRTLGTLGGKAVLDFCVQRIEKGFERDAVAAAQALQQRREPSVLPVALRVAGDPRANKSVRDEMFGVVEKIGGAEAQQGLVAIIARDPEEMVRYRAYEAALAVGQAAAVVPALEAFPAKAAYKKEDVLDFLVKDIGKLGPAAKPAVLAALASPSPLARMTALLALEAPLPSDPRTRLGDAADAATVLKLAGDKGTVKGFPAGVTVGKEAARVADVLKRGGAAKP